MKYLCLFIGLLILVLVAGAVIGFILKPVIWTVPRLLIWPLLILAGAAGMAFIVNAKRWAE